MLYPVRRCTGRAKQGCTREASDGTVIINGSGSTQSILPPLPVSLDLTQVVPTRSSYYHDPVTQPIYLARCLDYNQSVETGFLLLCASQVLTMETRFLENDAQNPDRGRRAADY